MSKDDDCMTSNAVYTINCKSCPTDSNACQQVGHYRGQTSRTMHVRMQEHVAGLRKGNMSCPLTRHAAMHHANANSMPDFKMKKFRKPRSIMVRLVLES